MPPLIYERPTSRPFSVSADTEELTRTYFVSGTTDEQEVYELLVANSPAVLGGMVRKSVKAEPLVGGQWFGDVMYAPGEVREPGEAVGVEPTEPTAPAETEPLGPSFALDTTGATVHITQAIYTRYRRTAADNGGQAVGVGTADDEKLAIGLTKDRVEGTDIYAPALTLTKTVQRANITLRYVNRALYGLVGRVNAQPFYTFSVNEVLYLGCTANFTQKDRWTITHKFAMQPNERDVWIGDKADPAAIKLPYKYGWDYLWVGYKPAQVGAQVLQKPAAAYVQQVYKEGDFSLLEIGV